MSGSAASPREKLARVGRVKEAALAEDTRLFLELDLGARLAATVAHCDAHLAAFGVPEGVPDADDEVWVRVRHRLAGRG